MVEIRLKMEVGGKARADRATANVTVWAGLSPRSAESKAMIQGNETRHRGEKLLCGA
jgi:hypothetical protein